MTLDDFERQLAEEKDTERRRERRREKESHRKHSDSHRHHHRHHRHRSSRDRDREHDEGEHRSKRRRRDSDDGKADESQPQHRHRHSPVIEEDRDHDQDESEDIGTSNLKRDSWMEAPSALDIDYVQRKRREPSPPKQQSLGADFELKIHKKELNQHLRDLHEGRTLAVTENEASDYDVDYTFGDAGSQWRMTKLKSVYRKAKETGRAMDEVALERYESLRDFDNAREEEVELGRRDAYGRDYVGKVKPSGDLYQERRVDTNLQRSSSASKYEIAERIVEGVAAPSIAATGTGQRMLDQTTLNKMKAQLMRAQLKNDPKLAELQREYNEAMIASSAQDPSVITLSAMDNRMLSSAPRTEVRAVQSRRGAERGQVEENEDMSIDDMVREERRTKGQGSGEAKRYAERIAKDGKFDNDLEYMDENAMKLAKRVHKSDLNLRNIAINEYQKLNKILDNCPLCHQEDTDTPPVAPVVSLATRTYLSLPTEPELTTFGAMIVPVQHRTNLMEADDDEWEEIRNFMKSLTRFYHDQGRDVIFYENAAHPHRKPHAALVAIPLPYSQGETAPAFFKEAFLTTEDEWSQHKKIIDTLAKSKQGLGKLAFRRTLVKEMPYFHVWFEIDGGLGHVVEDAERWPKGDLFAREIIGGMLGLEPDVIKRQGRWHRGHDPRVAAFQKKWRKFDWTRILTDS